MLTFCVSAETNQSIAITELFTHPDYRNRNVAESLVRAVTIYYLSKAPRPKRQLICLIPDSFDAATRVFARVGFRLGEQSRLEQSLTGVSSGFIECSERLILCIARRRFEAQARRGSPTPILVS